MDSKFIETPIYTPVCMIYSWASLETIGDFLDDSSQGGGSWSSLRVIRTRNKYGEWEETNRSIILLNKVLFDNLIKEGYHLPPTKDQKDFRIVPYELREGNLPHSDSSKNFFIRIPKDARYTTAMISSTIDDKMEPLVRYGLLEKEDYSLKVPYRNLSRDTGEVTKSCFVVFSDKVTDETATLIKAVIDDTYWKPSKETFHCFWARKKQERVSEKREPPKYKKILKRGERRKD